MIYLGIDPGLKGGIAALYADGEVLTVWKMPATARDLFDIFNSLERLRGVRAVLERVSASPQMGTVSAFTFGRGYGRLEGTLAAAHIPFEEVTPGTWQGVMGVRQKTGKTTLGTSAPKDKNISKRRAQALFPGQSITHANADALLIAEYCRRLEVRV
jgi:hypothetical protein